MLVHDITAHTKTILLTSPPLQPHYVHTCALVITNFRRRKAFVVEVSALGQIIGWKLSSGDVEGM